MVILMPPSLSCCKDWPGPAAAAAWPSPGRCPYLRSPFLGLGGPSRQSHPWLQNACFPFSPLSAHICLCFFCVLSFFMCFPFNINIFNLKFTFAPSRGGLVETRGPPPGPRCELSSFVYHLWENHLAQGTSGPPSVGCRLEAIQGNRDILRGMPWCSQLTR